MSQRRRLFRDATLERAFVRDGYVLIDLLGPDTLDALRELFRAGEGRLADRALYFSIMSDDVAYRKRISDGVKQLLAPRLDAMLDRCRPVFGQFFVKAARDDATQTDVHQDWSWVDETRFQSLNVWCPLSDVSQENGCLAVIPGSQHLNSHPRGGTSEALPYPELWPLLQRRHSVQLEVAAGQAVLFDQRLFHWAGPNRGTARRIAATCFVAPEEADLRYWFRDPRAPDMLEEMAVDDEFFAAFHLTSRPVGYRTIGTCRYRLEPLDEQVVTRILREAIRPDTGSLDYDGYRQLVLGES